MSLESVLNEMPFAALLGIEVTEAADGHAEARVPFSEDLTSVPGGDVAHGGVPYALADTVGGAAVMSLRFVPTPTVDMRIDYLHPARADLVAEADVVRNGDGVAVVDVAVHDVEAHHVASARGVYKTGGGDGGNAWSDAVSETGPAGRTSSEGGRDADG